MLLAIDVGNTNITFAVFDGDILRADWRIGTDTRRTGDEYAALLLILFGEQELSFLHIDGVSISSVVPAAVDALVRFSRKHLKVAEPLVLGPDIDLGIKVNYYPVTDVGADRIANAAAAHVKYGGKVIVVDFGTATTLDAVSEDGEYLGGAISPGIQISLEALFAKAARLTGVPLTAPAKAIGTTTAESLQSGIIFGFAGQVDALVDRFQTEMGGGAKVVATGGLAELIAEHSRTIEVCDDLLTLEGLKLIYQRTRTYTA
ncbi:MAG: type III pantothenate kinase [Armatimonadota bacterium]|nr:type III pantothenate kinase [bacterium]